MKPSKSSDPIPIQPAPFKPDGPRYSSKPFPPYRHVPGVTPHPRRHPRGHLYGLQEPPSRPFDSTRWRTDEDYLYGVDLYNFAYYWEAHEAWEGIWKTVARRALPGLFLQGFIQVSAALLKREMGVSGGVRKLSRAGMGKLRRVAAESPRYCGIDLEAHLSRLNLIFRSDDFARWSADPRIRLDWG